jgi:hypothetical protein
MADLHDLIWRQQKPELTPDKTNPELFEEVSQEESLNGGAAQASWLTVVNNFTTFSETWEVRNDHNAGSPPTFSVFWEDRIEHLIVSARFRKHRLSQL